MIVNELDGDSAVWLRGGQQCFTSPTVSVKEKLDRDLLENVRKLQTVSTCLVPGNFRADTQDHADHTFCGIMFGLEAKRLLPFHFVEIQGISVRGDLGYISVYCRTSSAEKMQWQRHFGPRMVPPSANLFELDLDVPIRLAPGMKSTVYVHSELHSDTAIVYDNQRHEDSTYEDLVIRILPGIAHTSNVPFSAINHWGGNAWRRDREFVGSIRYGVSLMLWTPHIHMLFPSTYRQSVFNLLCLHRNLGEQAVLGPNLGKLPKDVVFKIINFLPWDWSFNPSTSRSLESAPPITHGGGRHRQATTTQAIWRRFSQLSLLKYVWKSKLLSLLLVICCAILSELVSEWRKNL